MHKQESSLNRHNWVTLLWKISEPVLVHASSQTLKKSMPIHGPIPAEREKFSHLEAVGRTLAGLAPWLELEGLSDEETLLQAKARKLAQSTVLAITDPGSLDYLNYGQGSQPVVDAAYLAQAILRAPNVLWLSFSQTERRKIHEALLLTRKIKPYFNNWLLFSALIEALFCKIGAPFDSMRIDYAIRQTHQWYVGDGLYADGPEFHFDYYNSYVIHPFLLDILEATKRSRSWSDFEKTFLIRAQRYSELLERMISPEGTMPITGRSIAYRCGNLHAIAQLALKQKLPLSLSPAKVRCAMWAVISRTLQAPSTFDASGWLNIGLCGNQPSLAENYVSTGSMYIASLAFLPLGLPPEASFWSDPDTLFTSQLVYSGLDITPDMALKEKV
jgi:hypothetical protein